jgi:hypothetical protein
MSTRQGASKASENTPLLGQHDEESQNAYTGDDNAATSPRSECDTLSSLDSQPAKGTRRWPTIVALSILCLATVLAIIGFAVPSIAQEYAQQALVFEPDRLSIDSFTSFGVRTRIKGVFYLDASRVQKKAVRELGKAATWIAREVKSDRSELDVYLPDYGDVLLGKARVPPIVVNIRNRHYNHLDILADLEPGDVDGIRRLAKDFLDGRLTELNAKAVAHVPIRSGIIDLGTQTVQQLMSFKGSDVPAKPDFNITNLRLAEYGPPGHPTGVRAKTTVSIANDYPVNFDVPVLNFDILLPDCEQDYVRLATAQTAVIEVLPRQRINASVTGLIEQLPSSLTQVCRKSSSSPLDRLVADYLAGKNATVFVRGADQVEHETPDWIAKILRDTTLPFTLPGHPFDSLIKNFSLTDTHFSLGDQFGDDTRPKISAVVKVLVGLPAEMNVNLDVDRVRADADVYYKGKPMGKLDLSHWQPANATKAGKDLLVQAAIKDVPLEITDGDVFTEVIQQLIFRGRGVHLDVDALVDVNTATALGEFVVRQIPAQGSIFINPIRPGSFSQPHITDIKVVDSSQNTLTLQANANISNPTPYSAHVPYVNASIIVNDTLVGYAWSSADVVPGPNNITVQASWDTSAEGREWISRFLSGYNTTLTIRTHEHSIPGIPNIKFNLTVPTPHATDIFGHFLRGATVRLPLSLSCHSQAG